MDALLVGVGSRTFIVPRSRHQVYLVWCSIASLEWVREDALLPALVCLAPDFAQERRVQRVAQTRLAPVRGFGLWTTTEVLMKESGPLAPIWLKGIPQSSQVSEPEGS